MVVYPVAGLQPLRVLAIDDNAAVRSMLSDLLIYALHARRVDLADTGEAGLALFEQNPYDLVLTDLMMPGLDGVELAGLLRRRDPGVKLIMLTGSAASLEDEGRSIPDFPVLAKPVNLQVFRRAIEDALQRRD